MHRHITGNYHFLIKNRSVLGFGYLLTFFSSFGQTFLISLYVPEIIETFGLSKSMFGLIYALCTVASSAIMLNIGHMIDFRPVRSVMNYTIAGLALSSVLLGVSTSPVVLIIAITGLRLTGQGLMSHISLSVISRYYTNNRGKAISITALGYSIGEAVLPVILTWAILQWGWRLSAVFSGILLFSLIPLMYWNKLEKLDNDTRREDAVSGKELYRNYMDIILDRRFFIIAPSVFCVGFVITGFLFYQYLIAEIRQWPAAIYAIFFTAYAAGRFAFTIAGGFLVDKYSARAVYKFYLVPLFFSVLTMVFFESLYSALIFLLLAGTTVGLSAPVKSSVLAELYGTERIGTVRTVFTMTMVTSTALGPLLLGSLMDTGLTLETIFALLGTLVFAALVNNQRLK